jgi:hypothetical protein
MPVFLHFFTFENITVAAGREGNNVAYAAGIYMCRCTVTDGTNTLIRLVFAD